ncbi:MAG: CotH kinase family protein [Oscillospiraceae bacterium]|nr:CotH kinase family protein [Oscillospiraceae bacterium]
MDKHRIWRVFTAFTLVLALLLLPMGCADNPGGGEGSSQPSENAVLSKLRINEYQSKNSYTVYSKAGEYYDWVELFNAGDRPVALERCYLTDNPEDPGKWRFPEGTVLEAGAYLLIWCSGKTEPVEGELHASFRLSDDDAGLAVFDEGNRQIDAVPIVPLEENLSYGRSAADPAKLEYYALPTPGAANGGGFETSAAANGAGSRTVLITEVSAAYAPGNKTSERHDWIELHNQTGQPVSLKGYGLCKSLDGKRLVFGEESLAPGAFLVVQAAGDESPADADSGAAGDERRSSVRRSGVWYAPFQVDAAGETLFLLDAQGRVIDRFESGKLRVGESSGRPEQSLARVWFAVPTPGKANSEKSCQGYAPKPVFSKTGGYAQAGEAITVTAPEGCTLRYTSDGSEPDETSPALQDPLLLTETVTIRARAFQEGYLPSDTATVSYLVNVSHKIPIIFLSAKPDDLFGRQNGIMANGPGYAEPFPYIGANFWKDWERGATMEYYSAAGVKQLEFNCGINVFGQYTRAYLQKSLAVHLRDGYGQRSVTYPFFENNPILTNTDFVIRAAGQDQYYAKLRDAFCTQVLRGYSDCVSMDWQPVALYINGAYWGLYALREKINESFFAAREGLDPNCIDIIKGDTRVLSGDKTDWVALRNYVKAHDLRTQANYDYVAARLDIDNFIDYLIAEIFFANGDTGNKKVYRERPEGANGGSKWKWVLFDFDMTMRADAMGPPRNTIKEMFNPGGHGNSNMFFTALQVGLLKNSSFKAKFRARYLELLDTAFSPAHMEETLDRMAAEMEPEIAANGARWGKPTADSWRAQVEEIRQVIKSRPAVARQQLEAFLGDTGRS